MFYLYQNVRASKTAFLCPMLEKKRVVFKFPIFPQIPLANVSGSQKKVKKDLAIAINKLKNLNFV